MSDLLRIVLSVAGAATLCAVLLGLPLALLLGRLSFRGKSLLQALIAVPLVFPATLLGYYAVVLSRQGYFRPLLARLHVVPAFDWKLALFTAGLGALAIFVRVAQTDFARVDRRLEQAARTLGRSDLSVIWAVTLPLGWRGVVAGTMLAFCRAGGEFALTLLVARTVPGGYGFSPIPRDGVAQLGVVMLCSVLVFSLVASRLTRAVG
ncbi:MAG TPA: ABC transporter permease subunit [Gemmatimonadales bacterium]